MRAFTAIARFAAQRPGVYLAHCAAAGLILRWFWVGQDAWRFIDPLAPVFR